MLLLLWVSARGHYEPALIYDRYSRAIESH